MKKFFTIAFISLILPIVVGAYSETGSGRSVIVNVSPTDPGANERVNISLVSYDINLDSSLITWSLNGETAKSGVGEKFLSFTTASAGNSDTISVNITDSEGRTTTKTLVFKAGDLDLIWEADTYTPPFYQGKALATSESIVRVTTIPKFIDANGKVIPNESLVYQWTKDGYNLPTKSGYGKQSVSFKSEKIFGQNNIGVTVSDLSGNIKAQKNISIGIANPKILFYEQQPLTGLLYNRALTATEVGETGLTLRAEPFFFSNNLSMLNFSWLLDGKKLNAGKDPQALPLLSSAADTGEHLVKLTVDSQDSLLQGASASLKITKQKNSFLNF